MNTVSLGALRQALSEEQFKLSDVHRNRKHFLEVLDTIHKEVEESEHKIQELRKGIDLLIKDATTRDQVQGIQK